MITTFSAVHHNMRIIGRHRVGLGKTSKSSNWCCRVGKGHHSRTVQPQKKKKNNLSSLTTISHTV